MKMLDTSVEKGMKEKFKLENKVYAHQNKQY